MWEIGLEECTELWRENRAEILKWLESKVPHYSHMAHVLPTGQAWYHGDFSLEAMDTTNFEAVQDHFRFLGIDLDRYMGRYSVELPTIFNVSEHEDDLELGAVCAFFWNLDQYLTCVHPLLNEDQFYELINEEQEQRASEYAEGFESVDQWLTNYGHGHDLDYTGYADGVGDLPADYVRELVEEYGSSEWRELAYYDRLNYYTYNGIDG